MSRLPSITPARMVRALKRAGFVEHHQKGSHLYLWHDENKRMTSVPMHNRDLAKGTALEILEQSGLTKDQIRKLL